MLDIDYARRNLNNVFINISAKHHEVVLNDKSLLDKISDTIKQSIDASELQVSQINFKFEFENCHLSTDPMQVNVPIADLVARIIRRKINHTRIVITYCIRECVGEKISIQDATELSVVKSIIKEITLVNTYRVVLNNSDVGIITDFPLDRSYNYYNTNDCSKSVFIQINKLERYIDTTEGVIIDPISLEYITENMLKTCKTFISNRVAYSIGLGGRNIGTVSLLCYNSKVVNFSKAFNCAAIYEGKQFKLTDAYHFNNNNFFNTSYIFKILGFGDYMMRLDWRDNYYPAIISDIDYGMLKFEAWDLRIRLDEIKGIHGFN